MRPALALTLLLGGPRIAHATYSIVAVDRARGQSGIGVSSCVDFSVRVVSGAAAGHGQVAAQARLSDAGRDEAVRRLRLDEAPAAILDAIVEPGFDPAASTRQYAIVDREGRAAAYTGGDAQAWAGDRQGTRGQLVYSAQGNLLTGAAVLDEASFAFERTSCDLPERLMRALEAGAAGGGGDARCRPARPASSAYLAVDDLAGQRLVELDVRSAVDDPLPIMRAQLEAWRKAHPCPTPEGAGCGLGGASVRSSWPALLPALALLARSVRRPRTRTAAGRPSRSRR